MDTIEYATFRYATFRYATFRYGTVEVENALNGIHSTTYVYYALEFIIKNQLQRITEFRTKIRIINNLSP